MARRSVKSGFLWVLKNTLNRVAIPSAKAGVGPFALVRHVGRKTGRAYETPVILARLGDDFVAELTYGPQVAWYRNIVAAGGCTVVYKGTEYRIDRISPCDEQSGLKAYGNPAALILRLSNRHEFRLLHNADQRL
jgi:deazaflavin-dependent oxidoreductase (nitroreductase family)